MSGLQRGTVSRRACMHMQKQNLECFMQRVGFHPDRIKSVYFNYKILMRAVAKMAPYLEQYDICTGSPGEDSQTKVGGPRPVPSRSRGLHGWCVALGTRRPFSCSEQEQSRFVR